MDQLIEIPDFAGYYVSTVVKMYSLLPLKYRETEGIKDIGSNFWNQGRTQEIKERYVHLGNGK